MMYSLFAAGLACLAPMTAAYTTPTGTEPKGNPISQPGLNSIVPVDKSFTITWEPTTKGTVSLVLLKGPAENLVPVYAIAEMIENSGSYTWDPKDTLEPSEGAKGYGIQLIDDATGQYQYTTQFGISNEDYSMEASSSSAPAYAASSSAPAAMMSSSSMVSSSMMSSAMMSSAVAPAAASSTMPAQEEAYTSSTSMAAAAPAVTSAGMVHNSSVVQPTGPMTVPSSMSTRVAMPTGYGVNTTAHGNGTTGPEISTGAASNMAASLGGLVVAAGIAIFAL